MMNTRVSEDRLSSLYSDEEEDDNDDTRSSQDLDDSSSVDSEAETFGTARNASLSNKMNEDLHGESESIAVSRWRLVVILMLFVTAALVVTSSYIFFSRQEESEFRNSFDQSATTLVESTKFLSENLFDSMSTLSTTLTSEVEMMMMEDHLNHGSSGMGERRQLQEEEDMDAVNHTVPAGWPFVTIPHFEIKAGHARHDSQTELLLLLPLVERSQVEDWLDYSTSHDEWIAESMMLEEDLASLFDNHGSHSDHHGSADHGEDHESADHGEDHDEEKGAMNHGAMNHGASAMSIFESKVAMTGTGEAKSGANESHGTMDEENIYTYEPVPSEMFQMLESGDRVPADTGMAHQIFAPVWQTSPPPLDTSIVNSDMNAGIFCDVVNTTILSNGQPGLTAVQVDISTVVYSIMTEENHWSYHEENHDVGQGLEQHHSTLDHPHAFFIYPVRSGFKENDPVVALLAALLPWDAYLQQILSDTSIGIHVVLENTCDQIYTYEVNGETPVFLGPGDLHEKAYDAFRQSVRLSDVMPIAPDGSGRCDYILHIYPSSHFRASFDTNKPEVFTVILACVFVMTGLVFMVYVLYVQRRQTKVLTAAIRTNAIVTSLFPSNVRARLLKDAEATMVQELGTGMSIEPGMKHRLKNFLEKDPSLVNKDEDIHVYGSRPIADLFPETTILFADMVGFTAWSSVREPSQVFTLLETVYHAFDQIARRRRIFKVETVGDCYVAVAGLPEARKDHAVVMCRFAEECRSRLGALTRELERTLGPDTGDLSMRFGLHSGPVTAGVLRGERARFQLFGDTVNFAARMESTGERAQIQLSLETAELIMNAKKGHWIKPREDLVEAKGKGTVQTYWLNIRSHQASSLSENDSDENMMSARRLQKELSDSKSLLPTPPVEDLLSSDDDEEHDTVLALGDKTNRLIEWNVDLLLRLLRSIVARRVARGDARGGNKDYILERQPGSTVLDEVLEVITLPKFETKLVKDIKVDDIDLGPKVYEEVKNFVTTIALLYRENPFHNFEHASHVAMSVAKLLTRIVAPSDIDASGLSTSLASTLHDHTYGITSDPLTQFACVLSALIHDVDHTGVPNTQLCKENAQIAALYKNKSVAEQNSVDLSWNLLMDDSYTMFRRLIYTTESEFGRFRSLVVNSVMATDIMDKDLKALRNARWDKAFQPHANTCSFRNSKTKGMMGEDEARNVNRKATIVIEHLIQASDVSHTMQHWHIYRKWNTRLFEELYRAHKDGRSASDPADNWYEGEMGFFDFYIIPLAKKLKDCGVFGVSSDEYLNYALQNRKEWEARGREIVAEMKAKLGSTEDIPESAPLRESSNVTTNRRVVDV